MSAQSNSSSGAVRMAAKRKGKAKRKGNASRKWSGAVTQKSDALDLEPSVFRSTSAAGIAKSLKRSAEASQRRKGTPFQSAMSMLNFYINRGGANLSARQKGVLQRAKGELRRVFHRDA
jgi:hypothetical protein